MTPSPDTPTMLRIGASGVSCGNDIRVLHQVPLSGMGIAKATVKLAETSRTSLETAMCTIAPPQSYHTGRQLRLTTRPKGGFQVCAKKEMGTDRGSTSRARPECTREKIFAAYERDWQPKNNATPIIRCKRNRTPNNWGSRRGQDRKCMLNPQPNPELDAALGWNSAKSPLRTAKVLNDDVARGYCHGIRQNDKRTAPQRTGR